MQHATPNYPRGLTPVAWGREVGYATLARLLSALEAARGDGSYEAAPLIAEAHASRRGASRVDSAFRVAAFLEQALAAFGRRGVRVRGVLTDNRGAAWPRPLAWQDGYGERVASQPRADSWLC